MHKIDLDIRMHISLGAGHICKCKKSFDLLRSHSKNNANGDSGFFGWNDDRGYGSKYLLHRAGNGCKKSSSSEGVLLSELRYKSLLNHHGQSYVPSTGANSFLFLWPQHTGFSALRSTVNCVALSWRIRCQNFLCNVAQLLLALVIFILE